jgi:hypothetical protein
MYIWISFMYLFMVNKCGGREYHHLDEFWVYIPESAAVQMHISQTDRVQTAIQANHNTPYTQTCKTGKKQKKKQERNRQDECGRCYCGFIRIIRSDSERRAKQECRDRPALVRQDRANQF